MTRRPAPRKLMIMDACVLIDFIKAERAVLELVVKHIGPLHVTSPVVDEVNEVGAWVLPERADERGDLDFLTFRFKWTIMPTKKHCSLDDGIHAP